MSKVTLFISYRFNEFGDLVHEIKNKFKSIEDILEIIDLKEGGHLADERSPNKKSIETIQESDYFLGLLGDSYKLLENSKTSIIKNEHNAAKKNNCKIFSYYIGKHSQEDFKYLDEIPDYFQYEGIENNIDEERIKTYKALCDFKNELFKIKSSKDRLFGQFAYDKDSSSEKSLDKIAEEIYSSIQTFIISLLKPKDIVKQLNGVPEMPDNYIVRENDLKELKEKLLSKSLDIGITGKAIGIKGLGGVGKSVLANAVVREHEILESYPEIYWTTINQNPTEIDIKEKLIKILAHIDNDTEYESSSLAQITQKLENIFIYKKVILIVDDVWNIKDLKYFNFINYETSKRLITSRRESVLIDVNTFNLAVLSEEQALELLRKRVTIDTNEKVQLAKELLEQTGYLALAVSIISAMLKNKPIEYWRKTLIDFEESKLHKFKFDNENELHENLYALINVSYNYLNKEEQEAFLKLAIFPESFQINLNTLEIYFGDDYFELINKLVDDSLLTDNKNNTYSLHDLVRDFVIINVKDQISHYKKIFLESYIEYFNNNWSSFNFHPDNNDNFFIQNFIDFAKEIKFHKNIKKISEEILFLENTPKLTVLSIIKFLGLNKNEIAKKILWKNKSNTLFNWIVSVLGFNNEQVIKFAKAHLDIENKNISGGTTIKSMDVLGLKDEQVKRFSKAYLDIENKNTNDDITIKSMDVLGLKDEQVKRFSKAYLDIENKNTNDDITSRSMDVLGLKDEQVIKFAKDYLKIDKKNLKDLTTKKSIDVLGFKDEEVLKFSKAYLSIDKKNLNDQTTIKLMDVLGLKDEQVIKFAKDYLKIDKKSLYESITIKSMFVLGLNDEQVKTFAKDYLKIDKKSLYESITIKSMFVLGLNDEQVKTFAKDYLKIDKKNLNDQITIKSMNVLGLNDEQVKTFAKAYLKIDKKNQKDAITIKSMDVLGFKDEQVKKFAKKYITEIQGANYKALEFKCFDILGVKNIKVVNFLKDYLLSEPNKHYYFVVLSIRILGYDSEYSKQFAQQFLTTYTTFWSREHRWLTHQVRAEILLTETKTDIRVSISKYLLKDNLNEKDRSLVFSSLKVLQINTSIDLSAKYEEILNNWQMQLFREYEKYKYYHNHIIFSIENSTNSELIEKTKNEIINYYKDQNNEIGESLIKALNHES